MNKGVLFLISLIVIVISIVSLDIYFQKTRKISDSQEKEVTDSNMQLTSSSFTNNQMMPSKYTCDKDDISPPLTITGIPANTRSMALIVDDPDAPSEDWVHWLVWNIKPNTNEITQGGVPDDAIQGVNDFGRNSYGGPCPPTGKHRYQFKLYALDTFLNLSANTKKKDLEAAFKGHILDQTMLVWFYQKKQ